MKQVVIYPSGFIGYDVGWPIVQDNAPVDTKNVLARFSNNGKEKVSISNKSIEQLFHLYRTKSAGPTDAQFISDVVAAATNAFGTASIYEWVHMQLQSPYLTSYHRNFLNETLAFVLNGTPRSIYFPTWRDLLVPKQASPQDRLVMLDHQELRATHTEKAFYTFEFVERWLERRGGLEDMIYTLHFLFGDASL